MCIWQYYYILSVLFLNNCHLNPTSFLQFSRPVYLFSSRLKNKETWFSLESTASFRYVHMQFRCAVSFQWLSTRTQNILCGLSLPHIYIIKMRWAYRRWQKAQEWNQATCQSCHLLHWPKGPDLNPIRCRGGKVEMDTAGERRWQVGKAGSQKRNSESMLLSICTDWHSYVLSFTCIWIFLLSFGQLQNKKIKSIELWKFSPFVPVF